MSCWIWILFDVGSVVEKDADSWCAFMKLSLSSKYHSKQQSLESLFVSFISFASCSSCCSFFFSVGIISHCEIANPVKFAATRFFSSFSFTKKRNANDVLIDLAQNFFSLEYWSVSIKWNEKRSRDTSLLFDAYRVIILNAYFRVIGSLFKWCHEFMFSHTHFSACGFFVAGFLLLVSLRARCYVFMLRITVFRNSTSCSHTSATHKNANQEQPKSVDVCSGFFACRL